MNRVILMGRLTSDPLTSYYNASGEQKAISKYTLAVDGVGADAKADFIRIVAFAKNGEFAEKYLKKGMKILVEGRIKTDSYEDKDGKKVYTTDVIVEKQYFCESKQSANAPAHTSDGFMNIPDGFEEELPFN